MNPQITATELLAKLEGSKHTPGEWIGQGETILTIGPLLPNQELGLQDVVVRIPLDKPAIYCYVGKHNGSRQRLAKDEIEIARANARLIRHAPDLLRALSESQARVKALEGALEGVIRVADRKTAEFAAARAVLGQPEENRP